MLWVRVSNMAPPKAFTIVIYGLYLTMFIYSSLTDSTVHPEPSDNHTEIPFNISWFDFIYFIFIDYCFCFTVEISCFKYHFWLILVSIDGCFLGGGGGGGGVPSELSLRDNF